MGPDERQCFPAGTYEFETHVRGYRRTEGDRDWFGPYDWRLELTVEGS